MSSLASQLEMVARLEEERREEGGGSSALFLVILILSLPSLFCLSGLSFFSVTLCAMRLGNNTGNVQQLTFLLLFFFFSFLSFLFSTRFSLIHPNL